MSSPPVDMSDCDFVQIQTFTKRRSHEMDLRIATKLCEDQVVFWAPKVVWNWQSTSHSNRAGWFVRAMSMHEKERGVIIVVRSLHQERAAPGRRDLDVI